MKQTTLKTNKVKHNENISFPVGTALAVKKYSEKLAEKEEIIVGNKIDLDIARENVKILKENFNEVYFISALTGEGIKELKEIIWKKLEKKI